MKPDSAPIEEIEQELLNMCSPDFRGVRPGKEYQAALSLGRINEAFEQAPPKTKVLGFSMFTEWMDKVCKDRQAFSERSIYDYVKIGRYLLPKISEEQFNVLGRVKAEILATLAKAGPKRWSQELLDYSLLETTTTRDLEDRVDSLFGMSGNDLNIRIDSHEAAEAALITLGFMQDYETYTAHPAHKFRGEKLEARASVQKLEPFAPSETMQSAKHIDVIWLKEGMPEFFFEVENSTKITLALHRMFQVIKIDAKFVIVARDEEHSRYNREVAKKPYNGCKGKYHFRSYAQLERMFKGATEYQKVKKEFFP
jgi:hypothetical protein